MSIKVTGNVSENHGDTFHQAGYAVKQCFDGGYVLTGYTIQGQFSNYLVSTYVFGDTVWTRKYMEGSTVDVETICE